MYALTDPQFNANRKTEYALERLKLARIKSALAFSAVAPKNMNIEVNARFIIPFHANFTFPEKRDKNAFMS